MFHAPCVRGVGVVPSPIALCAITLHAIVHSTMLVALVAHGVFVGRKPRSKKKGGPASRRAFSRMPFAIELSRSLAMAPPRLIGGIIWCGEGASARHVGREGSLANLRQRPRQMRRDRDSGDSLARDARSQVGMVEENRVSLPVLVASRSEWPEASVVIPCVFATGTPISSSIEAGLTEGRSRFAGSRSCPRNVRPRLSSPGATRRSSRFKKVAPGRPPRRFGPSGAGRSPPVSRPPSRSR